MKACWDEAMAHEAEEQDDAREACQISLCSQEGCDEAEAC